MTDYEFPEILSNDGTSFISMKPESPTGSAYYKLGSTEAYSEPISHTFAFNKMDILSAQNAWAGVNMARNLDLFKQDESEIPETNPAFVYKTPVVRFVNKTTPNLTINEAINITETGAPEGDTFTDYFTAMLKDLIASGNESNSTIKLVANYAYDASTLDTPPTDPDTEGRLDVTLPIFLQTTTLSDPANEDDDPIKDYASTVNTEITDWMTKNTPPSTGAYLLFELDLFANIQQTNLPIIQLKKLWIDTSVLNPDDGIE